MSFEYQGISIDDLVDFTPEIRAMAVSDFRLGPLFTPPMLSVVPRCRTPTCRPGREAPYGPRDKADVPQKLSWKPT